MSEERLSKLQKWILIYCYKNYDKDMHPFLFNEEIFVRYWGKRNKSREVILSRALWKLYNRDYVVGLHGKKFQEVLQDTAMMYQMMGKDDSDLKKYLEVRKPNDKVPFPVAKGGKIKAIQLTKKGIEKAKLLMLSSS